MQRNSIRRRSLLSAFGAISLVFQQPTVAQQSTCSEDPDGLLYHSILLGGSDNCANTVGGANSKGWNSRRFIPYFSSDSPSVRQAIHGFPMNLSLGWGPGPGDLPPVYSGVQSQASPLAPAGSGFFAGAMTYPTRALVGGVVDIVTGSPLLTETDFELPFGGATYRHVRTYSEPWSDVWHEREGGNQPLPNPWTMTTRDRGNGELSSELYWDWHGQGWMMGESPMFLFDAAYLGIGAVPAVENVSAASTEYTCYFMPDAHRSIPFKRVVENEQVRYEAPPHIDAMMVITGGTFDVANNRWTQVPTAVDIFLNRRTLRYHVELQTWTDGTGVVHGLDVPITAAGVDTHTTPFPTTGDPGQGIPYYGLVTYIADRYGNRIELSYVPKTQYAVETTEDCETCHQNSHKRGQLSTARLVPAGTTVASWTLVYIYREFYANDLWPTEPPFIQASSGDRADWSNKTFARHRQTAVQSILVYEGDPSISGTVDRTIPPTRFNELAEPFAEDGADKYAHVLDAFDALDPCDEFSLPETWQIHARYMYADPHVQGNDEMGFSVVHNYSPSGLFSGAGVRYDVNAPNGSPRLVKRTVLTKKSAAAADVTKMTSIYRYISPKTLSSANALFDNHALGCIAEDSTVSTLAKTLKQIHGVTNGDTNPMFGLLWTRLQHRAAADINENDVLLMEMNQHLPVLSRNGTLNCDQEDIDAGLGGSYKLNDVGDLILERPRFAYQVHTYYPNLPSSSWSTVSPILGSPLSASEVGQLQHGVCAIRTYNMNTRKGHRTEIRRYLVFSGLSPSCAYPAHDDDPGNDGDIVRFPDPVVRTTANPALSLEDGWPQIGRSVLYSPYRLIIKPEDFADASDWGEAPNNAGATRWIAAVSEDEVIDQGVERGTIGENYTESLFSTKSWRVIELNAVGATIRDVTKRPGGSQEPNLESITGEQRILDPQSHAVLQIRTAGWLAAGPADQATTGLIKRFFYAGGGATGGPQRLVAEGFQFGSGTSQPVFLTKSIEYHPEVKHLPLKEIRYGRPVQYSPMTGSPPPNTSNGDVELTYSYLFSYRSVPSGPASTPSINPGSPTGYRTEVDEVRSNTIQWSTSSLPHAYAGDQVRHLREDEAFDQFGRLTYKYLHITNTPSSESPSWSSEHYQYEDYEPEEPSHNGYPGFLEHALWSSDPETKPGVLRRVLAHGPGEVAGISPEWSTSYPDYEITNTTTFGTRETPTSTARPRTIVQPNGTVTCEVRLPVLGHPDDYTAKIYTGFFDASAPNKVVYPQSMPVHVTEQRGGKVVKEYAAKVAMPISTSILRPTGNETLASPLWSKVPVYDGAGRLVELRLESELSQTAKARVGYDAFGKVVKLQNGNGSIVRTILDPIGRVSHVYRGTKDLHEVWGTAIDMDDPPCTASYPDDDMCLVESRDFGNGVRDAALPVVTRRTREKPVNQYRLEGCSNTPANNEASIGIADRTKYDIRMRPVKQLLQVPATPPNWSTVRTTVTWYDHQNRVRFVGVFSGTPSLGAADPESIVPANGQDDVPVASAILAASPLSLHESMYDPQGHVVEERDYDVSVSAGTAYTNTRRRYDTKDRVVYESGPNGRVVTSEYDYRDLLVSTTTLAVGVTGSSVPVEIEKTINEYDSRGRVWEIKRLERIHDAALTNPLDATGSSPNAVQTRTFLWYDERGLQIASAEIGTEAGGNVFAPSATTLERANFTEPPYTVASGRLTGIDRTDLPSADLPALAIVTATEYDEMQRVIGEVKPDGSVTRKEYDGLGRVLRVIENALASNAIDRRVTCYHYDEFGRLDMIATLKTGDSIDWDDMPDDGSAQVTQLVYGAAIVKEDGTAISSGYTDPDKVGEVRFPNNATGLPDGHNTLTFTYLLTGEIASRTDGRGVTLTYQYDERSNLVAVNADLNGVEVPIEGWATDIAETVVYAYDKLDRPTAAQSNMGELTSPSNGGDKIATLSYAYDGRGNLLHELQQHGDNVTTTTPSVEYGYTFTSANESTGVPNTDRLTTIKYPDRVYSNSTNDCRQFALSYGAEGSIDDRLSRLARIVDLSAVYNTVNNPPGKPIAAFAYAGLSRRVDLTYGENKMVNPNAHAMRLSARSGSGPGYDNLDSWGRTTLLKYTSSHSSNPTIYEAQIGYLPSGDVAFQRVKQLTVGSTSHDNDRSWLYSYDLLSRLVGTERGKLDLTTPTSPLIAPASSTVPTPRLTTWKLDRLSNWAGTSTDAGRELVAPPLSTPFGTATQTDTTHNTDAFNALVGVTTKVGSSSPYTKPIFRDEVGNIRFDGKYLYQYDAFNRLVLITEAGSVSVSSGVLQGTPGYWLKHFTYDAYGRLIRTQVPWPWLDAPALAVSTRRFFYDGGRRIQERLTVPLPIGEDGKAISFPKEHEFEEEFSIEYPSSVHREYVWDPDQTDRILAQVDGGHHYTFIPTDESWTPVGVVEGGASVSSTLAGCVLSQFSFDPMGTLLNREDLSTSASLHRVDIGHQGLFFEPYEDEMMQSGTEDRLFPSRPGLYFNRARWYDAERGRFTTSDPNQTGVPQQYDIAWHGFEPWLMVPRLDVLDTLGDGANLFESCGHNSVGVRDPTGYFGIGMAMSTGMDMADMALDSMEQAYSGLSTAFGLFDMIDEYASTQLLDAEWAGSWDWGDDWFDPVMEDTQDDASGPEMASGRMPVRSRTHGGALHNRSMRWIMIQELRQFREYGYSSRSEMVRNMRFNQAASLADGTTLSNIRPDIQFLNKATGKYHFHEVTVTNPQPTMEGDLRKLYGDRFGTFKRRDARQGAGVPAGERVRSPLPPSKRPKPSVPTLPGRRS